MRPPKAKQVSASPNERKIRAQKIREQAAQERTRAKRSPPQKRGQAKRFKAVRVIERSLFSMRMAGASSKDIAKYLRVAADQLEQDG
jgi:hypothetical protein